MVPPSPSGPLPIHPWVDTHMNYQGQDSQYFKQHPEQSSRGGPDALAFLNIGKMTAEI